MVLLVVSTFLWKALFSAVAPVVFILIEDPECIDELRI
jgi:hypothetical protein